MGALQSSVMSGTDNTVLGDSAGIQMRGASQNVIVGSQAGQAVQDVGTDQTVLVGYQAGQKAAGGNNACVGYQAGSALTTGTNNALLGYQAGSAVTTYNNCVCVGYQAGSTAAAADIIAVGYQAVAEATGALAVGYTATAGNTYTVALGYGASASGGGSYSVAIGKATSTSAAGCVALGTDSGGGGATTSTANTIQMGTVNHTTNHLGPLTVAGLTTASGKSIIMAHAITSGALSTKSLTSGTGAQIDTTSDRYLAIVAAIVLASDTVAIALSPNNTTYTTLGTLTPGVVTSSDIFTVVVPAAWYVKVTVTGSASITSATYY
jgi:hypothetical protein